MSILAASALVALGVVVFEPSLVDHSSGEEAQSGVSEPASAECSGVLSTDHACYEQRYQNLVHDSGGEAVFADLKDEYGKNELAKAKCHQLAHVIGRAAAEQYGDLSSTYAWGDNYCFAAEVDSGAGDLAAWIAFSAYLSGVLATAVAVSYLGYRYIESPSLRQKPK